MDEAEYCDRISIMVDGKIKAIGTPDALKQEYHQPDMDGVFTLLARQATRGEENAKGQGTRDEEQGFEVAALSGFEVSGDKVTSPHNLITLKPHNLVNLST